MHNPIFDNLNLRLQHYSNTSQAVAIATMLSDRRRSAKKVEVTPELARSILGLGHLSTCQIKAKLGCSAEQIRVVYDKEMYWRELLNIKKTVSPKQAAANRCNARKHINKYPPEHRQRVVKLALDVGTAEAAKRTGVSKSSIKTWVRDWRIM